MVEKILMTMPTYPIFVLEGLDIAKYDSIEIARRALEPIDVRNAVYEAYDILGRRLKLTVDPPIDTSWSGSGANQGVVHITLPDPPVAETEYLRCRLVDFLLATTYQHRNAEDLSMMTIKDLAREISPSE
jgi:hypothetical protein